MEHRTPKRKNIFEAFYNVPAALITPPFLKTSCTPNQITVLSGLFGVIGAFLLIFRNHSLLILAAVCIQLFAVLDLVDGNIARAKNLQSVFGHWLDIFFDKLNDFLLISALTIGAYRAVGKEHVAPDGIGQRIQGSGRGIGAPIRMDSYTTEVLPEMRLHEVSSSHVDGLTRRAKCFVDNRRHFIPAPVS